MVLTRRQKKQKLEETKHNPKIEEEEKKEEEPKEYTIRAVDKKATFEKEEWVNTLPNGKDVTVYATTFYRGGQFLIRLTEAEKASILTATSIELEDYDFDFEETYDGCERSHHARIFTALQHTLQYLGHLTTHTMIVFVFLVVICRYIEIIDEEDFSEIELHEIKQLLYCDKDKEGKLESWNGEDEDWCEDRMEANEWSMSDTYYGFQCGCKLTPMGGGDEGDEEED